MKVLCGNCENMCIKNREIKVIYEEKAGISQVGKVKKLSGNSESVDESIF